MTDGLACCCCCSYGQLPKQAAAVDPCHLTTKAILCLPRRIPTIYHPISTTPPLLTRAMATSHFSLTRTCRSISSSMSRLLPPSSQAVARGLGLMMGAGAGHRQKPEPRTMPQLGSLTVHDASLGRPLSTSSCPQGGHAMRSDAPSGTKLFQRRWVCYRATTLNLQQCQLFALPGPSMASSAESRPTI